MSNLQSVDRDRIAVSVDVEDEVLASSLDDAMRARVWAGQRRQVPVSPDVDPARAG